MYVYKEVTTITMDRNGRRVKTVKRSYIDDRTDERVSICERDTHKYYDAMSCCSFGRINDAYRDYKRSQEW